MRRIAGILVGLYLAVGLLLFFIHPRLGVTDELQARASGRSCGGEHAIPEVLAWPYYAGYYYAGGFEKCRAGLYRPPERP